MDFCFTQNRLSWAEKFIQLYFVQYSLCIDYCFYFEWCIHLSFILAENARQRNGVVGRSPVYLSEYVPRDGRADSIEMSPTSVPLFSETGGRHSVWPGVSVGGAVTRGSSSGGLRPLHLFSHVDLAPVTVTERTPMAVVIDLFRKLGLRQALVTKHGCVFGVFVKFSLI